MKLEALAPAVAAIVEEAGALAARGFRLGRQTVSRVWYKNGTSPVSESDIATNDLLHEKLAMLLPEAGWLSEETTDNASRLASRLLWIVDPIDGTRAFIEGHKDWCISVALIADGEPVIGNVFAPARKIHYQAVRNLGAQTNKQPLAVSEQQTLTGSRVAGPHNMMGRLEQASGAVQRLEKIPSLALRIARVAAGDIDVALVSTRSCDWDIAAADLVLREAGGTLTGLSGETIVYNRPSPIHDELAASSKLLHSSLIAAFTSRA